MTSRKVVAWVVYDEVQGESWLFDDSTEALDKVTELRDDAADRGIKAEAYLAPLVEHSLTADAVVRAAVKLGTHSDQHGELWSALMRTVVRHLKRTKGKR